MCLPSSRRPLSTLRRRAGALDVGEDLRIQTGPREARAIAREAQANARKARATAPNLSRYTESLRREVYDRVVSLSGRKRGQMTMSPSFTPDQAGLMVFYLYGRWFAVWSNLEAVGPGSVERKTELVRVQESTDTRYGIILAEV